jgi:copper chaperone NosL
MSRVTRIKVGTVLLTLVASGLLVASLTAPLWRMRMEAPQYRDEEALRVNVYPNSMNGDLREIKVLNQYVGVTIPEKLPQTVWLPAVLIGGAVLSLIAVSLPMRFRRKALLTVASLLVVALLASAGVAQWQMYKIGHDRNHKAALRGVKDFTPPLLGKQKIENFTVSAWLGAGAYLIVAAIALEIGGAFVACGESCPHCHPSVCPHEPHPSAIPHVKA